MGADSLLGGGGVRPKTFGTIRPGVIPSPPAVIGASARRWRARSALGSQNVGALTFSDVQRVSARRIRVWFTLVFDMARKLPSLERYLEQLPLGVDSHPACQLKASVYRSAVESRSLDGVLDALPFDIRELVTSPPPVSTWVREVHANSLMIAVRDVHFQVGAAGLDDYSEWTRQRNVVLMTRPLYRALFRFLSPDRLLRGLEGRWHAFRRGTTADAHRRGPGHVEFELHYPSHLYDEVVLAGLRGALVAALEAAGGEDAQVELLGFQEQEARYAIRWR
ncbi:MAG: DUF2378 family protein [Polyangiaceae bacterium]